MGAFDMADRSKSEETEIELRPDGWERFKQAVHAAAKERPEASRHVGPEAERAARIEGARSQG
jgi:hypothetical protein